MFVLGSAELWWRALGLPAQSLHYGALPASRETLVTTFTWGLLFLCCFLCAGCCCFCLRFVLLYQAIIFIIKLVNIKKEKGGLERWLSSQGYLLFFQKSHALFPEGVSRTHYCPLLQIQRIWYSQSPVHTSTHTDTHTHFGSHNSISSVTNSRWWFFPKQICQLINMSLIQIS